MSPRGVHRKSRASDVLLPKILREEPEGDLFTHCQGPKCSTTRSQTSNACNCRPCPNCDAVNGAIEKAAVLPHCGSVLCEARIRRETGAMFPSCACPCAICERVANVAGYSRPDGTRGVEPPSTLMFLNDPILEEEEVPTLGDPVLEEEDAPVVYKFKNGTRVAGLPGTPVLEPMMVTEAEAEAGASPSHRLRVLVDEVFPPAPVLTGSKCSLARNCLYWLRDDVERQAEETSEEAAIGTLGHAYGEEYARGRMTTAREAEIIAQVRPAKREKFEASLMHVRRWLDEHRRIFTRAEVPVAWDPEASRGIELEPWLKAWGLLEDHRAYANGATWRRLRDEALLGELAIPATLDLVCFEEGEVLVYDWCWGRTDKRYQLALGALALRDIHQVDTATGVALYVDGEGVREVTYRFAAEELDALAEELLALRKAAPTSSPLPGTHCVHDYCPARTSCPVTQASAEMVVDPQAPGELIEVPIGSELVPFERRLSTQITDRAFAEWVYPRLLLMRDFGERGLKALHEWIPKQAQPWLATGPGKALAEISVKGRESFNQKHAIALLKSLGATDEQLAGCWLQGAPSKQWREKNLPKELGR